MLFVRFIIKKLPAKIIYQNNILSCFLPRNMEVYGHLLVIPNKHFENIFDIPEEELTHSYKVYQKNQLASERMPRRHRHQYFTRQR